MSPLLYFVTEVVQMNVVLPFIVRYDYAFPDHTILV